jgi:hypothetical protein
MNRPAGPNERRFGASFFVSGQGDALSVAGAALLAIAMLLPVGDAPWYSFWREWTAASAVLLLVFGLMRNLQRQGQGLLWRPTSLPAAALALAALCWLQYATGLLPWRADAVLASLYLAGFALCALVAQSLDGDRRARALDLLAAAFAATALLSSPLAVLQWLGHLTLDMGIKVAGGRPVAHMEQANLLCSLSIQGALGLWRLAARGHVRPGVAAVLLLPILTTVVLTQSRVAWLVAMMLLLVVAWRRDLLSWRAQGRRLAIAMAVVLCAFLLLPTLDGLLGLSGTTLAERASGGRRPAAWMLFADAISMRPIWGWGVLNNGAAQFEVALRHVSLDWYFSSAHDLPLDLMLWFGVPVGLATSAALFWAALQRLRAASDTPLLLSALSAAALLVHALVEFPLHYAYFLLPLGLLLGATGSNSSAAPPSSAAATQRMPLLLIPPALVLAVLASDYVKLTDVRPVRATDPTTLRDVLSAQVAPPEVLLLEHLQALHRMATVPLEPGVGSAALQASRQAMLRFPMAAVIERHALAAGISGDAADAAATLLRLCRFEPARHCEGSQEAWEVWRDRWPQLPAWPAPAAP